MSGHGKGSAFERKIAKEIIKAYRKAGWRDLTQNDCWRSVLSGGHDMSAGDLRMSSQMMRLFPFAVECKHRKKIRIENFFVEDLTEEKKWIRQAVEGAQKGENLTPVLVMKANFLEILAFVGPRSEAHDDAPEVFFNELVSLCGFSGPWRMMPWHKFLKLAIQYAKGLR